MISLGTWAGFIALKVVEVVSYGVGVRGAMGASEHQ